MAKLGTGAEYIPRLPEEFPESVFPEFEKRGGVPLAAEQRQRISEAACLLVDGIYRHSSRPNARKAKKQLETLIGVLERTPARGSSIVWERVRALLYWQEECRCPTLSGEPASPTPESKSGEVAEALRSLLLPLGGSQTPVRTLSIEAQERWRTTLLADAKALLCRLEAEASYTIRGPEPAAYIDVFILRLADVYRSANGRPSASYNHESERRDTPFVRLVAAVAAGAVERFAPDIFAGRCATSKSILKSVKLKALEERVRVVLAPSKAEKRRTRARKYFRSISPL
jgi:hypothetical protein